MFYQLINLLANTILNEYFVNTRCILIFQDTNTPNFIYNGRMQFVNIWVQNGTFNEKIIFNNYFGCQGIVINTKTPVLSFTILEDRIRNNWDRFNLRRYLFIPTENLLEDVMEIFKTPEIEFIADLNLIWSEGGEIEDFDFFNNASEEVVFEIYTHKFVGANETNLPVLLDKWFASNESFLYGNDLYPDKLHDCMGREFKIATFSYKPYSVPASKEGTELELVLAYIEKHNLTPFLVIDEEGEWGEIYDNWTGYGILGNVLNDNGDIGLAALYTWAHEYGFLDLSKPVVRTGITCLAPAPRLAGGWLVPLFSFTYEMWIAVFISYFFCSFVLFAFEFYNVSTAHYRKMRKLKPKISKAKILQNAVMQTTAIFLIQSLSDEENVKDRIKKYVYACMFLFSLLITSTYSSGLASSLTVPRYVGAIKTVQDLVDSGIQWGATSIAWIMSIMDAPEHNYIVLVQRFVKTDGPRLRKYNNKRFAFSIERLPAGQYAIGDYITEQGVADLRLMNEDLYWEQCVLMTKKSSIWLPSIDDFILQLHQTGIGALWEWRVATTHLNAKIQRAVRYTTHHTTNSGPEKLTWANVQGAFAIWIGGSILAFLTFITELVIKCRKPTDLGLHLD